MNTSVQVRGLCETCGHSEKCAFLAMCDHPRLNCEEFFAPGPVAAAVVRAPEVPAAALEADAGLMGLCVNCQGRAACEWARRPGGIWFCEEYS